MNLPLISNVPGIKVTLAGHVLPIQDSTIDVANLLTKAMNATTNELNDQNSLLKNKKSNRTHAQSILSQHNSVIQKKLHDREGKLTNEEEKVDDDDDDGTNEGINNGLKKKSKRRRSKA